jgi:D-alanyl-D-alanine carboxypeptidase
MNSHLKQPAVEIATYQSPPFSLIAAQTLKPSQNLYTELILRTLGKAAPPLPTTPSASTVGQTTEDLGLEVLKHFSKLPVLSNRWCSAMAGLEKRHDHS